MKRIKYIYNPKAGQGQVAKGLDEVVKAYQLAGYEVTLRRLDVHNTAPLLQADEDYDHLLVAGGDGTLDLVVNEIMDREEALPIGLLPAGTANDFARFLDLPDDLEAALNQVIYYPEKALDLGLAGDRYFINVFSLGHFATISQDTPQTLKSAMGKLAYFIKTMEMAQTSRTSTIRLKALDYEYEGEVHLVMVFNGLTAGNVALAHQACLADGRLDVILMEGRDLSETLPAFLSLLRGDLTGAKAGGIHYFQTPELEISGSKDVPSDVDGEKGPSLPLKITCCPGALKLRGVKKKLD